MKRIFTTIKQSFFINMMDVSMPDIRFLDIQECIKNTSLRKKIFCHASINLCMHIRQFILLALNKVIKNATCIIRKKFEG